MVVHLKLPLIWNMTMAIIAQITVTLDRPFLVR
jgi:hypothetical protein